MTLMEYLIKTGSERVAQQCRENIYAVQTLKDFQYIDRDGKDQVRTHTHARTHARTHAQGGCYATWSNNAISTTCEHGKHAL